MFRKSHDLRFEFEQSVEGIEPFKAGLEVRDKVCNDVGSELGGDPKLLFVKYRAWRDVSWIKEGTAPSKALNERSLS